MENETPNPETSDLAAIERQPRLFSDEELDRRMDEEEQNSALAPKPRHTADRVLRDRPEDYRLAIDLLGAGQLPKYEIARLCKMSEHTLLAIQAANQKPIAEARAKMVQRLVRAGELALDAVTEHLADPIKREEISFRDKVIGFGVINDHALKMTGQPTEIVGKLEARPDHKQLQKYAAPAENAETGPAPWDMVTGSRNPAAKRSGQGETGSAGPAAPGDGAETGQHSADSLRMNKPDSQTLED